MAHPRMRDKENRRPGLKNCKIGNKSFCGQAFKTNSSICALDPVGRLENFEVPSNLDQIMTE